MAGGSRKPTKSGRAKGGLKLLMVGPREVPRTPCKEPSLEEVVEILSKPSWKEVLRVAGRG
jgi:hypothetical protein